MSDVAAMLRHMSDVRERLRNPINAVMDTPINLKRPIPIDKPQGVIVSWDVFGPKYLSIEDLAFGPIVHPRPKDDINPRTTIQEIQREVCRYYRVTRVDLLSERRTMSIVRPRQIAMYLAKTITLRSLPEIGRRFGGRDHTTVLHSVRKITALRMSNESLDAELAELENLLVAYPSQTEDAPCNSTQKPTSTAL